MDDSDPEFTLFDLQLANTSTRAGSSAEPATRAPEASAPLLAYDGSSPGLPGLLRPSPAFGPDFQVDGALPDIRFTSADNALFYAHRHVLQRASTNAFGGLLTRQDVSTDVPESSAIFSIALHVVYGLSCLHLTDATLEMVESAIELLRTHGIPVNQYAAPHSSLFQLVLSHARNRPIDTYALAAHHRLEDIAVAASAHLLAYDLSTLTDELVIKMGPVYTKRLFNLHHTRRSALKDIVLRPPARHPPSLVCGPAGERQLTHAWALAAAELAWNASPNVSTYVLQRAFERAGKDIACVECSAMLAVRIQQATAEWSAVQRTI